MKATHCNECKHFNISRKDRMKYALSRTTELIDRTNICEVNSYSLVPIYDPTTEESACYEFENYIDG